MKSLFSRLRHLGLFQALALSGLIMVCACAPSSPAPASLVFAPIAKPVPQARELARVFISGHSLTNVPMPEYLALIAQSLSHPLWFNHQIIVGSSIQNRTRGAPPGEYWSGYRQGNNREGAGLDVLQELRSPQTVSGGPYDTLLITELHGLAGSLIWEDTVPALLHFHNRLIEANPKAQTYLFEPWSNVRDVSQPADWVAYERAASPMWRCVATRVNMSLAARGRVDRIHTIPAGLALAQLIERATGSEGLPGITQESTAATVELLLSDQVHLTSMGNYFMALLNYSAIYQQSPLGAWAPQAVNALQAKSLQEVAWAVMAADLAQTTALSLPSCQAQYREQFCRVFWAQWSQREKGLLASWKARRQAGQCVQRFSQSDASNPLYFDALDDAATWWPAP